MNMSEYEARMKSHAAKFSYSAHLAGVELLNKEFDKARKSVADAAWFLFSVTQMSQGWLMSAGRTQIRDCAKRNGEAAFNMVLPVSGSDCDSAMDDARDQIRAIIESGMKGLVSGIAQKYIEISIENFDRYRAKTADAAQFLWRSNTNPVHDREDSLINCSPEIISLAARYRQEALASTVADNAWIAFDEGGFEADLKCASPGRIQDLAAMAKAKVAREAVGTMDIEGYGASGERITVRGIVVRRADSGSVTDLSALLGKQYGIVGVTSVSLESLS